MPNTTDIQPFIAAATVTVDAHVADIWTVWADVNAWPSWDEGLEKTEIRGNFKAGNRFLLTPRGGQAIEVLLKSVTAGEEFTDEAVLPFGTIRHYHSIEPVGDRLKLTHEVHAEINCEAREKFEREIWPHMQAGLSAAVNNIVEIVQA